MKILLDTHIFLWHIRGDRNRLPSSVIDAIQNPENTIFLSSASVWEITIKAALGKISFHDSPVEYVIRQREFHQISSLPVEETDMEGLQKLPLIHRDPFDRILIAQCLQRNLTLATLDPIQRSYPISILSV